MAFRGGTALNKLFVNPAARYSEDIDLVQVDDEPIGKLLSEIRRVLDPWLGKARWSQSNWLTKLIYRFESADGNPLKLKIEINTVDLLAGPQYCRQKYNVDSSWYSGDADITTFTLEELMATKLRAFYQRRKGRDLFDLYLGVNKLNMDCEKVVDLFEQYNRNSSIKISRAQLESNVQHKILDPGYLQDVNVLLHNEIQWDSTLIYKQLLENVVPLLPGKAWKGKK